MADSPKQAEAAQALFSAVVDYYGKPLTTGIDNYTDFKKKHQKAINAVKIYVETPGVHFQGIETFLTKDLDWFKSSVNIANKLLEFTKIIAKKTYQKIKPKGLTLYYVRGDRNIFDGFAKIWDYTNKSVKNINNTEGKNNLTYNNINKWSPADIYLASTYAKRLVSDIAENKKVKYKIGKGVLITTLANFKDFSILNAFVRELIVSGDLLPLSLKKAPEYEQTKIKTINFLPSDVQKVLKEQNIGYQGYIFSKTPKVFNSKDVYIKFTTKGNLLQFRDKGSSGMSKGKAPTYSYQGIITGGKTALDGGLAGQSIGDVLISTNPAAGRMFALQNQKKVINDATNISVAMHKNIKNATDNSICKKVFSYVNKYSQSKYNSKDDLYKALYKEPGFTKKDGKVGDRARAQFIFGKYLGGSMIEIFEKNKILANEMVTNMILYAGSRSKTSSPHFKASDISAF